MDELLCVTVAVARLLDNLKMSHFCKAGMACDSKLATQERSLGCVGMLVLKGWLEAQLPLFTSLSLFRFLCVGVWVCICVCVCVILSDLAGTLALDIPEIVDTHC